MRYFLAIMIFISVTPASVFAETAGPRSSCQVCGMYIDQYQGTAAELVRKNGQRLDACGMACLLRIVQDEGGPDAFSSILVRDWESRELTAAGGATYVIGSRVIPDMLPSIIAFRSSKDAEVFMAKNGGATIDFHQALNAVSPMGMTMPTRIKAAVLPPKGAFGMGLSRMCMRMDDIKLGSKTVAPADVGPMAPQEMTTRGEMIMLNYGLTDTMTLSATLPYLEKEMDMYTLSGVTTSKNSGLGDLGLTLRYNLWRDGFFSRFFTLLAGTSLPTANFDTDWLNMPGLQLGAGDFTFTGGLLYSQRLDNFWLHGLAGYTYKLENSDNYKFGNESRIGAALHYTPNYDLMLGLELDGVDSAEDELAGVKQGNTGGFRSNLSGVVDWKFLTALGGNFSVRFTAGLPIYEDLNHYSTGMMEKVALGGGYFANLSLNFKRRYKTK